MNFIHKTSNRSKSSSESQVNLKKRNREVIEEIKNLRFSKPTEINTEVKVHHSFDDFDLSYDLKNNIFYRNYGEPTPIQDQVIPEILKNRDIIGIANTGTGKTAAFLIPLIEKVISGKNERVLILVPTRELAIQISDEMYGFAFGLGTTWTVCVGGTNMKEQWENLEKNPDFIIGTPGRIKDFVQKNVINMKTFTRVVLDEADRMVDIGFINEIKYFLSLLSPNRQSLFFSATVPPKVDEILKSFVKDPVTISVKTGDTALSINQQLIEVNGISDKMIRLINLLDESNFERVLIFGKTKQGVQKLSQRLSTEGFKVDSIHGNKTQDQRSLSLSNFKSGKINILIATDIASRGIDINDISHVINFDVPNSIEDYVHRIGRTGRANKTGTAITFIDRYAPRI